MSPTDAATASDGRRVHETSFVLPDGFDVDRLPARPDEFSFVVLSDRTGPARPGVFERAIEVTRLLRPDFAIHIGDAIDGYTTDREEIQRQWAHFDELTAPLDVPLVRVPGNHDLSNSVMRDEWLDRFGCLHHHFVYRHVLYLIIDTQDPPQRPQDIRGRPRAETPLLPERTDGSEIIPSGRDWNSTMPANIGDEQLTWLREVSARYAGVRWTFVLMHMPIWQGEHPAFGAIREALGPRPYTMFAGHVHNYRRTVIGGMDHIRLGPSGGCWNLWGDEGNFDHITWVTVTPSGPRVANLVLDGVIGVDGGRFEVSSTWRE